MRSFAASGAATVALNPSRSMSARRNGASQSFGSVRMFRVAIVRPSRIATLTGPPPSGIAPITAYWR